MEPVTLQVEVRAGRGKGPARQLRANGQLPAVLYGPGVETTVLSVSPRELEKALTTEYRRNVVLRLDVGGAEHLAMVKELQVHPVTRRPIHLDLYRVSPEREVTTTVPVTTSGRAIGVQKGGKLNVVFREVPVRVAPNKIPAAIDINVAHLDVGDVFKVTELALPEGVTVLLPPDRRLALVSEDRRKAKAASDEEADKK